MSAEGAWQPPQVKPFFDMVADRLAATAPGAAEVSGMEAGCFMNSGWRRQLTSFLQTHVLMFTALEVGDLVGGAKMGSSLYLSLLSARWRAAADQAATDRTLELVAELARAATRHGRAVAAARPAPQQT